jgi:hypothetical protein
MAGMSRQTSQLVLPIPSSFSLIVEDLHAKLHHTGVGHTLSVCQRNFIYLFYNRWWRKTFEVLCQCIKCRIRPSMPQPSRITNLSTSQGFCSHFHQHRTWLFCTVSRWHQNRNNKEIPLFYYGSSTIHLFSYISEDHLLIKAQT